MPFGFNGSADFLAGTAFRVIEDGDGHFSNSWYLTTF